MFGSRVWVSRSCSVENLRGNPQGVDLCCTVTLWRKKVERWTHLKVTWNTPLLEWGSGVWVSWEFRNWGLICSLPRWRKPLKREILYSYVKCCFYEGWKPNASPSIVSPYKNTNEVCICMYVLVPEVRGVLPEPGGWRCLVKAHIAQIIVRKHPYGQMQLLVRGVLVSTLVTELGGSWLPGPWLQDWKGSQQKDGRPRPWRLGPALWGLSVHMQCAAQQHCSELLGPALLVSGTHLDCRMQRWALQLQPELLQSCSWLLHSGALYDLQYCFQSDSKFNQASTCPAEVWNKETSKRKV